MADRAVGWLVGRQAADPPGKQARKRRGITTGRAVGEAEQWGARRRGVVALVASPIVLTLATCLTAVAAASFGLRPRIEFRLAKVCEPCSGSLSPVVHLGLAT